MSILRAASGDMGWASLISENDLEGPFDCHKVWADVAATASRSRTTAEDPSASVPDAGKMPCATRATAPFIAENGLGISTGPLPSRATPRRHRQLPQLPRPVMTNLDVDCPRTATTNENGRDHQVAPPTSGQQNNGSRSPLSHSRLCENVVWSTRRVEPSATPLCSSNFPFIYPPRPRPLPTTARNHARGQLNHDPPNIEHTGGHQSLLSIVHTSTDVPRTQGVMARPISSSELWDITNSKYPVNDVTPPEVLMTRSPDLEPRPEPQPDAEAPIPLSTPESGTSAETLFPLDSSAVSGEHQIYERRVCFTRNFESFDALHRKQSLLRVSRSQWDKPATLKFQLTTVEGGVKEHVNFDVHVADHELVIAHAYVANPAWQNVLYIHRRPKDEHRSVTYSGRPAAPSRRNIVFMCRFQDIQDLADFQQALLGEALVLDISSVRSVRCTRRCMREREALEISNCRIQIWHEDRTSPSMQSDTPSIISNTTRLLSRPAENSRPRHTRVVVFLGRREEYMTFLITDDVELVEMTPADSDYRSHYGYAVIIRPRRDKIGAKPGSFSNLQRLKLGASPAVPLKVWHARQSSHAAGFPLSEPSVNFDDDDSYHECQSFEIEFEAEKEYRDFVHIWNQAIHFRREKKVVLRDIEEKQGREQFTAKVARRLYFHSLS